jgi:hypothetical protein
MPHVFALSAPDLGRHRGGGGRHHGGGGHHHHHGHGRRHGGSYYYGGGPSYYTEPYYDVGPCGCPNVYHPVIGTDDRVYRNGCVANCFGVGVKQPAQGVAGLGAPPSNTTWPLAGATEFFAQFGPVVGGVMVFGLSVLTGLVVTSAITKVAGK